MMEIQDQIEMDLELVAATAIEDKLQDQVGIMIFLNLFLKLFFFSLNY